MKILHICAGWQRWNGAANIARMIMDEQRRHGHDVSSAIWAKIRDLRSADEVWIHCGWLPCLWWASLWGRNIRWMPEACYDPVRLKFSAWKKRLAGPVERWALRRCERVVATCGAEKIWIEKYLGTRCPQVDVTDIKRFFDLGVDHSLPAAKLNVLYLGRRHPLKGVEFLEKAVAELNSQTPPSAAPLLLKIVSGASGAELESVWEWCDVLVLPTLSDNFGLVVAEALERGKKVITTDGAPAWGEQLLSEMSDLGSDGSVWSGHNGRLLYLKGYRNGSEASRVLLIKRAIRHFQTTVSQCDIKGFKK